MHCWQDNVESIYTNLRLCRALCQPQYRFGPPARSPIGEDCEHLDPAKPPPKLYMSYWASVEIELRNVSNKDPGQPHGERAMWGRIPGLLSPQLATCGPWVFDEPHGVPRGLYPKNLEEGHSALGRNGDHLFWKSDLAACHNHISFLDPITLIILP